MEMDPRAEYNQDLYRRWRDARADWDSEARKDVDFYLGNHFTASESDELNVVTNDQLEALSNQARESMRV